MGEKQTEFVMCTWLISMLLFFGLICYRIVDGGVEWLLHSPDSLIACGIISLSAYVCLMFSQTSENREKDVKKRDRDHEENTNAIRALAEPIRSIESTVDELERKSRV